MVGVAFPQPHPLCALNGGSKFDKVNQSHSGLKNRYTWNSIHSHIQHYAKQCIFS